jgi:hypothetical protein
VGSGIRAAATTESDARRELRLAGGRPRGLDDAAELPRRARGEPRPSVPGATARIVSGPPLQAQGRFASQATALRAALDLGASATLGQVDHRAGRWPALIKSRAAAPTTDSAASRVKVALTQYLQATVCLGLCQIRWYVSRISLTAEIFQTNPRSLWALIRPE